MYHTSYYFIVTVIFSFNIFDSKFNHLWRHVFGKLVANLYGGRIRNNESSHVFTDIMLIEFEFATDPVSKDPRH